MINSIATPYLFVPKVIRAVVKPNQKGVYVLGNNKNGFKYGYVGRSDSCIKTRLLNHNHLYEFEYFIFLYTVDLKEAFYLESQWWHNCNEEGINNIIHPASPAGSGLECPYCHFARKVKANLAC